MKYFYGLDLLRALMMVLGVFTHGALFVNFSDTVSYTSIHGKSEIISYSIYYLTLFRMETFFLLCGFLANMIFTYKTTEYFIDNRKKRVLIPLISSLIVFITIPTFIIYGKFDFQLKHLWFLLCLLILSLISCNHKIRLFFSKSSFSIKSIAIIAILFCASSSLNLLLSKLTLSSTLSQILNYFILLPLYYSIFYFLGFMLFNKSNVDKVRSYKVSLIVLSLFFSTTSIYLYYKKYIIKDISFIEQAAKTLSDFGTALSTSLILFSLFLSINYTNKFINFLKESSLIIYVAHFMIIMTTASYIDHLTNNVYSFYFLNCLVALILSSIIYVVFKNFKVTRYFFGIK